MEAAGGLPASCLAGSVPWRGRRCPVPLFWDDTAVVPPGNYLRKRPQRL
jgi:hypothetical protein